MRGSSASCLDLRKILDPLSPSFPQLQTSPPETPKRPALLASGIWPNLAEQLRLSPSEVQVVKGVFRDDKEQAIAAALGISPHTVSAHLPRIYAKLRIGSRPQLIVRVVAEYLRVARPSV